MQLINYKQLSLSIYSFLTTKLLFIFDKTNQINMNQFGHYIRELRIKQNIRQRQIAALLEADTAFVSKMEKGTRKPRREQVILLADLFKTDKEELLSIWLAEKVYDLIKDEEVALKSLKTAEINVKLKNKKTE